MTPAVEIVHGLHREEDRKIQLCLILRHHQPEIKLPGAVDYVLQDLVDRVLVFPCPAGYLAPHFPTDPPQEGGRRYIAAELRRAGEKSRQVSIVEIGVF